MFLILCLCWLYKNLCLNYVYTKIYIIRQKGCFTPLHESDSLNLFLCGDFCWLHLDKICYGSFCLHIYHIHLWYSIENFSLWYNIIFLSRHRMKSTVYVAKLKLLSPWELAFIYELKINAFIDNFGTKLS